MKQNINNNFHKFNEFSTDSREISRVDASTSQEANYFAQTAQQHQFASQQAFQNYSSTLNALENASAEEQQFILSNDQSSSDNSKAKQNELRQKAQSYHAKQEQESALATFFQNQAENAKQAQQKPAQNVLHQEASQQDAIQQQVSNLQSIDKNSLNAINEFKSISGTGRLTTSEIDEMYLRYSRQISVNSAEAWSQLDSAYSNALGNAFTPDNTMDSQSKNAISNFRSSIHSNMTTDEMNETFLRFTREVSIKFPQAWKELESILNNSLPNAYRPDTSMDAQSRSAIANFKSAINSGMTADEMNESFLRFSREVSIKYPDAMNELESVLSNYIPNAHKLNTTTDAQAESAIASFKSTIEQSMTKDQMVETFVRFSREVSINFPDAWNELESVLNQNVPNAFKPNTKSDAASEQAVTDFKNSISEHHTKEDLTEMFLRFSRNISMKYPEKKNELVGILNNSLPNAFVEDTTIDKDSENLVENFQNIIHTQEMGKDEFKDVFADFFKQIGLNLTKAREMMNEMRTPKAKEANKQTENKALSAQDSHKLQTQFTSLVGDVTALDKKVQNASAQLSGMYDKEQQNQQLQQIERLMGQKTDLDTGYFDLMAQINGNQQASFEIKDDYLFSMTADTTRPAHEEILEKETEKTSEWDMLRSMRREEMKRLIENTPKEELSEILYNVPKYHLINGLTLLPHEQQVEALTTNRFEDGLLREMPRKQLIEMLPDAYEMLPVVMTLGATENGFKNGVEVIEDTVINGTKVEEKPNETRMQEELLPFMMEQLLNKTPRMADATNPVSNKSAVNSQLQNFQTPGSVDKHSGQQVRLTRVEDLLPHQLNELAQEALAMCDEDQMGQAQAAKRGSSKDMMNFLDDLKKVDSVDAGKMAMENLWNSQAQELKNMVIPKMSDKELLKTNKFYGRDEKEMVKELPTHVVHKQLHDLSKIQVVQAYKQGSKDMIMDRLQILPSQSLAKAASQVLDKEAIASQYKLNKAVAA